MERARVAPMPGCIKAIAVLVVCTAGLLQTAQAQVDTAWFRRYNGPGNSSDDAVVLAVDTFGNCHVAGHSTGAGTGTDFVTIKYDSAGAPLWIQRYDGPLGTASDNATAIGLDNTGSVYVAGNSTGSGGNSDIVTIKYNSAGVQQWLQRYNGTGNGWDYATALAVDGAANIIVVGYGLSANNDIIVVKYDSLGTELWVRYFNGPGNSADYATSVAIGRGDSIVVGGYCWASTGSYNYAVRKYDPSGNTVWTTYYNGIGNSSDYAYALALDQSGSVYVTGGSYGLAGSDMDMVTVKLAATGETLWTRRINGAGNDNDDGRSIRVDRAGNAIVCGTHFGLGSVQDLAVVSYSPTGVEQWSQRYNGSANLADYGYSVTVDTLSNIYAAGYTSETGLGYQMTVVKYDRLGVLQWASANGGTGAVTDLGRTVRLDQHGAAYLCGSSTGVGMDFTVLKLVEPDVAVTGISAPAGRMDTLEVVAGQATVRNSGTGAATFNVWFDIRNAAGTLVHTSTRTVAGLASGASQTLGFDTWPRPHFLGRYITVCRAYVARDRNTSNDSMTGEFTVAAGDPGWAEVRSIPLTPSGRTVKDGGCLTYCGGDGLIYALKGNKTGDFHSYNPYSNAWSQLPSVPAGPSVKLPYKGAALASDGAGKVYCVKGNNTLEFWRYSLSTGWELSDTIPLGPNGKKVKGGGELVYNSGYLYFLKGYKNEFYRFNTYTDRWETLPPAPSATVQKWDRGSFMVHDGARYIYACKAKYNELWRYEVNTRTWDQGPLAPMPFVGTTGKSKKLKDGGCGIWYDGWIYALKGSGTCEFWGWEAARNSWVELETIPSFGSSLRQRRVKQGGDITSAGFAFYAFKGSKTQEFWRYILPAKDGAAAQARTTETRTGLRLRPNPARGSIWLTTGGAARAEVYDRTGRRVALQWLSAAGRHRLALPSLSAGVYVVRLSEGGRTGTAKLVIQ